jgi:hypothetical protein
LLRVIWFEVPPGDTERSGLGFDGEPSDTPFGPSSKIAGRALDRAEVTILTEPDATTPTDSQRTCRPTLRLGVAPEERVTAV